MSTRVHLAYERSVSNVGALASEFFGTLFETVIGLGVAIPAFIVVLGPGAGLGLTVFVLTYLLWIRGGAHLNPVITMAKAVAWLGGLSHRDYYGAGNLVWDLLFGVLYIGLQLAGAVIGVLFLKFADTSGLIAAATRTVPNGNLAGKDNIALALAFMCNLVFAWVHLSTLGPRSNAVIKQLGAPLVIGITYGGIVIVTTYWGAGTVCNFAIDLALATLIHKNSPKTLWISAVAQILGALGGALLFLGQVYLDRNLELQMEHGAKNMDHLRAHALAPVFERYGVLAPGVSIYESITGSDRPLVNPHDMAPEQFAAAAATHPQGHHHHHNGGIHHRTPASALNM